MPRYRVSLVEYVDASTPEEAARQVDEYHSGRYLEYVTPVNGYHVEDQVTGTVCVVEDGMRFSVEEWEDDEAEPWSTEAAPTNPATRHEPAVAVDVPRDLRLDRDVAAEESAGVFLAGVTARLEREDVLYIRGEIRRPHHYEHESLQVHVAVYDEVGDVIGKSSWSMHSGLNFDVMQLPIRMPKSPSYARLWCDFLPW